MTRPADSPGLRAERRAELLVLAAFGASFVAGVSLLVLYILGGQSQLEGVLLTVCLGGIGVGVVIWSKRLMPAAIHVEERVTCPEIAKATGPKCDPAA